MTMYKRLTFDWSYFRPFISLTVPLMINNLKDNTKNDFKGTKTGFVKKYEIRRMKNK